MAKPLYCIQCSQRVPDTFPDDAPAHAMWYFRCPWCGSTNLVVRRGHTLTPFLRGRMTQADMDAHNRILHHLALPETPEELPLVAYFTALHADDERKK